MQTPRTAASRAAVSARVTRAVRVREEYYGGLALYETSAETGGRVAVMADARGDAAWMDVTATEVKPALVIQVLMPVGRAAAAFSHY